MRFSPLVLVLCAGLAGAAEDGVLARAKAEMERVRALVEAGAMPRAQLERAEDAWKDASDAALLRRTLYGPDLTEDQLDEMLAAAGRRLERRKKDLAEARGRVEAGAASQLSLGPYLESLDLARKEYDLADSRARLCQEVTRMAKAEMEFQAALERSAEEAAALAYRFDGTGTLTVQDILRISADFERRFGRPLPVSAMGETAVHRAMGFDHRGRMDVALHPDQIEGMWLTNYLTGHGIPFYAFRQAVKGKSTGAHIHVGPLSPRIARGG